MEAAVVLGFPSIDGRKQARNDRKRVPPESILRRIFVTRYDRNGLRFRSAVL